MGLFHPFCRHCEEENEWLKKLVDIQAEIILNLSKPKPRQVKLIITFNKNLNSNTMSLELKPGQSSVGTLSLVYTDDNSPVPGVTFTNLTAVSDNESVASVTANPDATVTANGISAGTASATINAVAAFSDASGARSEAVSGVESIVVDAIPPPPRPVGLLVSWSTPV